jgi:hypothetical protein
VGGIELISVFRGQDAGLSRFLGYGFPGPRGLVQTASCLTNRPRDRSSRSETLLLSRNNAVGFLPNVASGNFSRAVSGAERSLNRRPPIPNSVAPLSPTASRSKVSAPKVIELMDSIRELAVKTGFAFREEFFVGVVPGGGRRTAGHNAISW